VIPMSGMAGRTGFWQHMLTDLQAQQCSEVIIPLHTWRTDTFRSDRMSQITGITTVRGQKIGILGNYALAR
jgi:hypothetical protein